MAVSVKYLIEWLNTLNPTDAVGILPVTVSVKYLIEWLNTLNPTDAVGILPGEKLAAWRPSDYYHPIEIEIGAMTPSYDDLCEIARQAGREDLLDEAIHDMYSRLASKTNNEGIESQVQALVDNMGICRAAESVMGQTVRFVNIKHVIETFKKK